MGLLDGMTDLSRSHNLELLPTVTATRFGALDRATGRFDEGDLSPEGGLNVKYGVTSNLTADVTFNPDFSQIESDLPQIEVNQRFALFYPSCARSSWREPRSSTSGRRSPRSTPAPSWIRRTAPS